MWEIGQVIPLHKPGKTIDESKGFRPIALLSHIAKLTSLKEHQQGFRLEYSTTTALIIVNDDTEESLHQRQPCNCTLFLAFDLTAAFNTVDYNLLLRDLLGAPQTNSTKSGVASFYRAYSLQCSITIKSQCGEMSNRVSSKV